jgi:16S rRNA (guanine527-N7)-methyltransferase
MVDDPSQSQPPDFGPPAPLADAAIELFGDRLPVAIEYAWRLGTDGLVRGLIGPRETDRLWDRHLLNCAAVTELIPSGSSVVDVGSGAGLPGIVLSVARPDLTVVLVEPLARRTAFLSEVVADLGLSMGSVVRARAEDVVGDLSPADVVTARAVASLDRLAAWCLPLARIGGRLLALKGATAADEIEAHRDVVARLGGGTPVIRSCGAQLLVSPTTVIEVPRKRNVTPATTKARSRGATRSRPGPGPAAGAGPDAWSRASGP